LQHLAPQFRHTSLIINSISTESSGACLQFGPHVLVDRGEKINSVCESTPSPPTTSAVLYITSVAPDLIANLTPALPAQFNVTIGSHNGRFQVLGSRVET